MEVRLAGTDVGCQRDRSQQLDEAQRRGTRALWPTIRTGDCSRRVAHRALGFPVSLLRANVTTGATVMAGLNCGTVSAAAWPILRDGCDAAVAVNDTAALRAVADLGGLGVSSGPSGAATLAGVRAALTVPDRRAALGIDATSTLVLLSTEAAS
jgi:diaminopropionate ammonia-lyase